MSQRAAIEPNDGVDYSRILTPPAGADPREWVAPGFALLVGLVGQLLSMSIIVPTVLGIGWLLRGKPDWKTYYEQALSFAHPEGMLAAHLALGALIPIVLATVWWLCRRRPAWVMSVQPGMRWRYLLLCLPIPVVLIVIFQWSRLVEIIAHPTPQSNFWWYVVITVLFVGFQAAGEEFLFRGLLLTAAGAYLRNRYIAVVASALLFAMFHGTQNLPMLVDRFGFGVLAGLLVVFTGGLEAAIAAHAVNNMAAFLIAAVAGQIVQTRGTAITWAQCGLDLLLYGLITAGCVGLAKAMRCATTTPGQDVDC